MHSKAGNHQSKAGNHVRATTGGAITKGKAVQERVAARIHNEIGVAFGPNTTISGLPEKPIAT